MSNYHIKMDLPDYILVEKRTKPEYTPVAKFKKSPDPHNMISVSMAMLHVSILEWKELQRKEKRRNKNASRTRN